MKFLVFDNRNGLGDASKLILNWDSVKYIKPSNATTFFIELNSGANIELTLSPGNSSEVIDAINRVVKANPNTSVLNVNPSEVGGFLFSSIVYNVAASGSIDGSGTANEVAVFTDPNTISSISSGTSGQVLTSNGAGSDPSFQTLSSGPATEFDESLTNITTFSGPNNFIGKNIVQKAPSAFLGDQPTSTIAIGNNVGNNSAGDNGLGGKICSNNILIGEDVINNQSAGASFGFSLGAVNNTLIGKSIFNNFDDGSDARFAGNSVLIGHDLITGSITGVTGSDAITRSVIIGDSIAQNVAGSINTKSQNILIGCDIESLGTTAAVSNQVVIGTKAFELGAGGNEVVAIGYRACAGGSADQTTAIGADAGRLNNLGQNSTVIGYNANASLPGTANEFTLGNSSVSTLRCQQTTITSLSDERDKTSIEEIPYGLDFVDSLLPKRFVWDNRAEIRIEEDEDGNQIEVEYFSANKGKKDIGFIAQDLQTVDNDWLNLVYDVNPERLEASYGKLIPVLVKAIQELSAKVTALENDEAPV